MYTLIIVDDEKAIVDGLKLIIERNFDNCQVIGCAYDGMDGYNLIMELRPHIVITDIRMLQNDGLSMIDRLQQVGSQAKYLILSGYSEFEYARRGIELGVKFYLNKPVEEEQLFECINKILLEIAEEHKQVNEIKELRNAIHDLMDINTESSTDDLEQGRPKDVISEVKNYITNHYDQNISLTELSSRFFIHPHYLSQLFKEKTGETYMNYLTRVRIHKSKQMLIATDLKLYEICQRIGYSDVNHFNKMFEKWVGFKPNEYRKMRRGEK